MSAEQSPRKGSPHGSLSPRGDQSPNSSQRHDDPFQKFFEEKDHMNKDSPVASFAVVESDEGNGPTFTPYEMSILYFALSVSATPAISLPNLLKGLEWYIKPTAGGADSEYIAKTALLANALNTASIKNEEGDIKAKETAALLETTPSAFTGIRLHIGSTATPSALEYLVTYEKFCDEDHQQLAQKLIQLDTNKDGVFNLVTAFRELMRTLVPMLTIRGEAATAEEESKEITRRILNTASVNAEGAISLSDFIELYAMEVYIIPTKHRTIDTAAVSRRIDLSDYSLLWAAVNSIRGIDASHIEAALAQAASVEGVVADECSLMAITKSVTSFIEAAADKGIDTDAAMQQLSDILVLNPTSLHIPVMSAEDRQEVAVRKLLLYFKPSAVQCVLKALLLEDIRGDGILNKPMAEAALMSELSSARQKAQGQVHVSLNGSQIEEYVGIDEDRIEEMIRTVLLSAGEGSSGQEVNLSHFIQTLVELSPPLPPRYCADVVAKFKSPVQLNELLHLQELLVAALVASGDALTNPMGHGCFSEKELRDAIDQALVSLKDDPAAKTELFDAFKASSINATPSLGEGGAFSISLGDEDVQSKLLDMGDALLAAVFETTFVAFPVFALPEYHGLAVAARRVAKGNVRNIAKAFSILDVDRSKLLSLEVLRPTLKENAKFISTEALEEAFSVMDIDGDGALCFEEFLSSFNFGPRGAVLSKAQLSSLTNRRMSLKDLHQGSVGPSSAPNQKEPSAPQQQAALTEQGPQLSTSSPSKGALVVSLASGGLTPTQLASSHSPLRRSTKALSPHHDASGVPIDDGDLRAEFERYDRDNNGFLDRKEFTNMYRNMENFGLEPTDREIDNLFNKVCGNRNRISYDEFSLLMLRRSRM